MCNVQLNLCNNFTAFHCFARGNSGCNGFSFDSATGDCEVGSFDGEYVRQPGDPDFDQSSKELYQTQSNGAKNFAQEHLSI